MLKISQKNNKLSHQVFLKPLIMVLTFFISLGCFSAFAQDEGLPQPNLEEPNMVVEDGLAGFNLATEGLPLLFVITKNNSINVYFPDPFDGIEISLIQINLEGLELNQLEALSEEALDELLDSRTLPRQIAQEFPEPGQIVYQETDVIPHRVLANIHFIENSDLLVKLVQKLPLFSTQQLYSGGSDLEFGSSVLVGISRQLEIKYSTPIAIALAIAKKTAQKLAKVLGSTAADGYTGYHIYYKKNRRVEREGWGIIIFEFLLSFVDVAGIGEGASDALHPEGEHVLSSSPEHYEEDIDDALNELAEDLGL